MQFQHAHLRERDETSAVDGGEIRRRAGRLLDRYARQATANRIRRVLLKKTPSGKAGRAAYQRKGAVLAVAQDERRHRVVVLRDVELRNAGVGIHDALGVGYPKRLRRRS